MMKKICAREGMELWRDGNGLQARHGECRIAIPIVVKEHKIKIIDVNKFSLFGESCSEGRISRFIADFNEGGTTMNPKEGVLVRYGFKTK